MEFEWDPEKADLNRAKHGVSFEVAKLVFDDPLHRSLVHEVHSEERWTTMGVVGGLVLLVVVHTVHERDGEETIRIISARKATSRERNNYEQGN